MLPRVRTNDGGLIDMILIKQIDPSGSVAVIVNLLLSSRMNEEPLGY